MAAIQLNHEASAALVTEARREFENAAHELWGPLADHEQTPTLDACVEIIGRLAGDVEHWPQEESPVGPFDRALVEFEFTPETLAWMERQCASQEGYVADLDAGANEAPEPGYPRRPGLPPARPPRGRRSARDGGGLMPALTVEIPDEAAVLLDAPRLNADPIELRGVVAWNIDARADQLKGWAESSDRPVDVVRQVVSELDRLARIFEALSLENAGAA